MRLAKTVIQEASAKGNVLHTNVVNYLVFTCRTSLSMLTSRCNSGSKAALEERCYCSPLNKLKIRYLGKYKRRQQA